MPCCSATDKPFEVRGSTLVEFADGKISRMSDYWDLATYMRQVGLMKQTPTGLPSDERGRLLPDSADFAGAASRQLSGVHRW